MLTGCLKQFSNFQISNHAERLTFRNRNAFVITDTELKHIAFAAIPLR
jgi:hypothetical protein